MRKLVAILSYTMQDASRAGLAKVEYVANLQQFKVGCEGETRSVFLKFSASQSIVKKLQQMYGQKQLGSIFKSINLCSLPYQDHFYFRTTL